MFIFQIMKVCFHFELFITLIEMFQGQMPGQDRSPTFLTTSKVNKKF